MLWGAGRVQHRLGATMSVQDYKAAVKGADSLEPCCSCALSLMAAAEAVAAAFSAGVAVLIRHSQATLALALPLLVCWLCQE
jgi:hypothetical protein